MIITFKVNLYPHYNQGDSPGSSSSSSCSRVRRKQSLAGEESQRSDGERCRLRQIYELSQNSGGRAWLLQRRHVLDDTYVYGQKNLRTIFVTDCVTVYFSFFSVESVELSNRGF